MYPHLTHRKGVGECVCVFHLALKVTNRDEGTWDCALTSVGGKQTIVNRLTTAGLFLRCTETSKSSETSRSLLTLKNSPSSNLCNSKKTNKGSGRLKLADLGQRHFSKKKKKVYVCVCVYVGGGGVGLLGHPAGLTLKPSYKTPISVQIRSRNSSVLA